MALKFLWAPLVDRFGSKRFGHYRGWLIATQTILRLGAASPAWFDPVGNFNVILVIFTVLFVVAGAGTFGYPPVVIFATGLAAAGLAITIWKIDIVLSPRK